MRHVGRCGAVLVAATVLICQSFSALLAEGQSMLKLGQLNDAKIALQEAINTVEGIKDPDIGSDEKSSFFNSITWFFRQKVSPYVAMAEVLIRQDKPLEALLYAELAKARTLLLGRSLGAAARGDSFASTTVTLDQLSSALQIAVPDQKTAALEYLRGGGVLVGDPRWRSELAAR